jgi:hypothetical protein
MFEGTRCVVRSMKCGVIFTGQRLKAPHLKCHPVLEHDRMLIAHPEWSVEFLVKHKSSADQHISHIPSRPSV